MIIKFSPVRIDEKLELVRDNDVIILNGEVFDFSPLSEGATLPLGSIDSDWFTDEVNRIDGELELTIRLPHGDSAPESTRFPENLEISENGIVNIPPHNENPEV